MMDHYNHQYWGMHWLSWVILLIFLLGIFIWLIRSKINKRKEENALEILKKRLAKGEINKEEYEEIKRTLDK